MKLRTLVTAAAVTVAGMFASSPALSALEHPVYDIWVLECKNAANLSSANSE